MSVAPNAQLPTHNRTLRHSADVAMGLPWDYRHPRHAAHNGLQRQTGRRSSGEPNGSEVACLLGNRWS
jgi:hypothetical protein